MKIANKLFWSLMTIGILVAVFEVGYLYFKRDKIFGQKTTSENPPTTTSTTPKYPARLDGVPVETIELANSELLGLMVDNHPNARPQSGLSQARVVYEVPVEGGITRYFALFNVGDSVAKVGPVRSARPYFLDWISEYGNTSFWHSGGSAEALDLIKQYKTWDVNEFYFGPYFWRSSDREAPHNLYTSSEKWQKLISGTPHENMQWRGWKFDEKIGTEFKTTDVLQLQIKYENNYLVGWNYDAQSNKYLRNQNSSPYADEAGATVLADTVIVQVVEVDVVDEEGRKKVNTISRGDARILRDGKMIRGYWQKDSRTNRTRYYDMNDREITLRPGKIWIQIIPTNTALEVSA